MKNETVWLGMQKWEFDVFGMVKTNLDWRFVQEDEKPYARIKEWWTHSILAGHITPQWLHKQLNNSEEVKFSPLETLHPE